MTSLAALLLLVAWNMSEAKHFVHTLKVAPKSDVMVLLTCFGLTVAIDMVVAVTAGILLAALLFMRRMAEVTETTISSGESILPGVHAPKDVLVYDISGPLFFGAAQRAMAALGVVTADMRVVILRLDHVPAMDATGLVALESSIEQLRRNGCFAIITGLQTQPRAVVTKAHVGDAPGVAIRDDLGAAVALAETKLSPSSTKTPTPAFLSS
jgi:SulP family sulfate permease